MLRCLHFSLSRAFSSAAAAVALTGAIRADEATRPEPPRPIMRMPQWIESIGEPAAKRTPQSPGGTAPSLTMQGGNGRPAAAQPSGSQATVRPSQGTAVIQPVADRPRSQTDKSRLLRFGVRSSRRLLSCVQPVANRPMHLPVD